MRKVLKSILIAAVLCVPVCSGQEFLDEVNSRASQLGGVHLVGVSVFSGYSTSAYPEASFEINTPGIASLGGDVSYGASASVAWQHHTENTNFSALYTGTYTGMVRYSNLNAFGHTLSLAVVRTFGPRWTFSVSASGQDSTIAQYLFQPSSLGVITQLPTSFDDLAAAFSVGQYSNSQVASMLTGAPVMQSAGSSLLLGDHVLSYSAQANVAYVISPRLQVHFASFAAAGQTRLGGQNDIAAITTITPHSVGADAGLGFSYSLSPRTDVGAAAEVNHTVNHYQSMNGSSASAYVGRKMGMHWFLNVHAGAAYGLVTQQVGVPQTHPMIGGGSLGFRTSMHTLVASYERTSSDPFGLAVGTVTTMSGAWNWHQAGSRWSIFASYGEQQTRNTGFASLSGWQTSAGISTALNPHASLSAQYVYGNSTGTYAGVFNNIRVQSVRVSVGWAPQVVGR